MNVQLVATFVADARAGRLIKWTSLKFGGQVELIWLASRSVLLIVLQCYAGVVLSSNSTLAPPFDCPTAYY